MVAHPGSPVGSMPIAKYVLAAEFDNSIGAVVKQQIPRKIPGFKQHLGSLGELMIPQGSEHTEQGYSVFVLYKDSANKYRLLPDMEKDLADETSLRLNHMTMNSINTIFEREPSDSDILFFFNVTVSIPFDADARGRIIRSIAVGTPLRNFFLFKHLITATILSYVNDPQVSHLVNLFNVMNCTDISLWSKYLAANGHLHNLLALNYDFSNSIILAHFKNIKSKDVSSQSIKYTNGVLQYYTSYDQPSGILTKIPFNFSLCSHPSDINTDMNVCAPILKFLHSFSGVLNKVDYKNFNIVIYSSARTDILTSFILTLSNFLNGFNKPYFHNDQILYFPLVDLYNWEKILEFDHHTKNTKIIGTNNLILKDSTDFYDFFYDLDTEELHTSPDVDQHGVSVPKTHDFMELTQHLLTERHDYNTVRISLQRFNVWEILKILTRDDSEQELNLRDYYLSRNKNVVIFDELFEFKTIILIDTLRRFLAETDHEELRQCYKIFKEYISIAVKGRMEMFLYLLEIFPNDVNGPRDLLFDINMKLDAYSPVMNELFKPVMYPDLQQSALSLYRLVKESTLHMVLEHRLNPFIKLMLEEKIK